MIKGSNGLFAGLQGATGPYQRAGKGEALTTWMTVNSGIRTTVYLYRCAIFEYIVTTDLL